MNKDQDESPQEPQTDLVASSTIDTTNISTESKNSSSKSTSGFTSQKQLLALAKQFVLDGALLPEDKQAWQRTPEYNF